MVVCPKCRGVGIREVPLGKRLRVECSGCGRFVGWNEAGTKAVAVAAVAVADPTKVNAQEPDQEVIGTPETWLYASKRLALTYLPNVPLWAAPAITFGTSEAPVVFFRLSAIIVAWLEVSGWSLERKHLEGELAVGQLDEYLAAMNEVWVFAGKHISVESVKRARVMISKGEAVLPEASGPK